MLMCGIFLKGFPFLFFWEVLVNDGIMARFRIDGKAIYVGVRKIWYEGKEEGRRRRRLEINICQFGRRTRIFSFSSEDRKEYYTRVSKGRYIVMRTSFHFPKISKHIK